MNKMPSRDISGKCEGECRDRVRTAEKKNQKKINAITSKGILRRSKRFLGLQKK